MISITVPQTGLLVQSPANGNITGGTNTLTDATSNNFHSAEANSASFWINGAGAAGGDLIANATTVNNAASINLSLNAGTTVTNGNYLMGDGSIVSSNRTTQFSVTFKNNTARGNLLFCGINVDPTLTVSVIDNSGNAWAPCSPGITNADYFQRAYCVLSAVGGPCTVTVTASGTVTFIEIFLMEVSAPGSVWSQDAIATGNGSNTALTTGTYSTTGPNAISIVFTGVNASTSGIGAGYTCYPSFNMGGSGINASPYGDVLMQKIFTSKQTNIAATATQSPTGIYVMTAVTFKATQAPLARAQFMPRGF